MAADDAVTLHFHRNGIPENYKAGQHGAFVFDINGEQIVRNYSFHPSARGDSHAAITIRMVENGVISQHALNNQIDSIELRGVYGDFYVEPSPDKQRHLVMFAAGSGITPLMAMIHTILSHEPASLISLIYSNQQERRIIFASELRELQEKFANRLTVYHVLTRAQQAPSLPVFYKGRLSPLIVRKTVKKLLAECNLPAEFYVCGPHPFIQMVHDTVSTLNIDGIKIFKEHFFIPESTGSHLINLPPREVVLHLRHGETPVWVNTGSSILEAAEQQRLRLAHSCREGQCGTCRGFILGGQVELKKNFILSTDELKAGQILLCQAYPLSDNVVIQPVN